jgi:myo-inositol-1(or 4)-monophosphatase
MTDLDPALRASLAKAMRLAALEGGRIAMADFRLGGPTAARSWAKQGGSPVTEADTAVDRFLKERCEGLLPGAAWLSEETVDDPVRLGRRHVWVVDPIDGTRAYMAGVPDWCVCIALLQDDEPILGVVHAPALSITYEAGAGLGATAARLDAGGHGEANRIIVREAAQRPRIAGPKPMLDALHARLAIDPQPKVPSLALRIARIAGGDLDGGVVSPDSRDWDLAAADLVLREARGRITDLDGRALRYNRERPVHATLAAAGDALHPALLEAARGVRASHSSRA